ncbi:leukotriene C4 synthase isoform X1 [Takifugu flavidus]|uniref:leukotriene C4 synthase isoform X1 n=1 Tax=Takifugu flavidus TaxID=433684 RepID=UPI002544B1F2|nr:leukotriene C4 synthase isoform X1 [Takifugu flavidus]
MFEETAVLAAVTILGILQQAHFCLQVISARRKFSVRPPATSGPAEFERVFRAQANCSEYFPIFVAVLWLSGLFFSQGDLRWPGRPRLSSDERSRACCVAGLASACGLLYLYARLSYFRGYSRSPQQRLLPLYFSALLLWILLGTSCLGVLLVFLRLYLKLDVLEHFSGLLTLLKGSEEPPSVAQDPK